MMQWTKLSGNCWPLLAVVGPPLLHGYTAAWLHCCMVTLLHNHAAAWLHCCMVTLLHNHTAAWLHCCITTLLHGHTAAWPHSSQSACISKTSPIISERCPATGLSANSAAPTIAVMYAIVCATDSGRSSSVRLRMLQCGWANARANVSIHGTH